MAERLEQEPQSGKPLRGKLHGLWQLRIGPFRVWLRDKRGTKEGDTQSYTSQGRSEEVLLEFFQELSNVPDLTV